MRHGKITGLVFAVAVLAGTVGLVAPNAGAASDCGATIKIGNAEAQEGKQILFPVVITGPENCDALASMKFETSSLAGENAAEPGFDYLSAVGTADFGKPLGTVSATHYLGVLLKADPSPEGDELFQMRIFDVQGVGGGSQVAGGKIDDLGSVECVVCAAGRCTASLERTAQLGIPVTVGYETVDGRARAGEDFAGVRGGRMTIPAGASRGVITLDIFRNPPGEPAEEFYVVITSVSAGTIVGSGRIEVHILPG